MYTPNHTCVYTQDDRRTSQTAHVYSTQVLICAIDAHSQTTYSMRLQKHTYTYTHSFTPHTQQIREYVHVHFCIHMRVNINPSTRNTSMHAYASIFANECTMYKIMHSQKTIMHTHLNCMCTYPYEVQQILIYACTHTHRCS